LNYSNYIIAGNFDRQTNPYPHPTDFAHEICIRRMRILAGSVTSLLLTVGDGAFLIADAHA